MDCVFHLTSQGWREDPCAENERIETWRVEIEQHGSSRVIRWACIWFDVSFDMEQRRTLHRRFGSPPIVKVWLETDAGLTVADSTAMVAV